ncbi:MAG: hypothetical protein P1V36_09020 [Planctomycetota bacterium]|nr:hypothetical protein [Planctomycetota bacterium]
MTEHPEHAPEGGESRDRDPAEETVRIRLALGGVEIAFSGRRAFFEAHVARLLESIYRRAGPGDTRGGAAVMRASSSDGSDEATADVVDSAPPTFQPASPSRFQRYAGQVGANAATLEQRVMAFAFYLWNYERRETFGNEDVAAFFRTVHEEPPEDLPARLAHLCDAKRFLDRGEDADVWRLTTKGVNYVKNRLLGSP